MKILKAAVKSHEVRILKAQEDRDSAIEAAHIPTKHGLYTVDLAKDGWRYPAVDAASKMVRDLSDDNGYYWACSRLMDLERILGVSVTQLPLRTEDNFVLILCGHIPEAHPSVSQFLMS